MHDLREVQSSLEFYQVHSNCVVFTLHLYIWLEMIPKVVLYPVPEVSWVFSRATILHSQIFNTCFAVFFCRQRAGRDEIMVWLHKENKAQSSCGFSLSRRQRLPENQSSSFTVDWRLSAFSSVKGLFRIIILTSTKRKRSWALSSPRKLGNVRPKKSHQSFFYIEIQHIDGVKRVCFIYHCYIQTFRTCCPHWNEEIRR